MKDGAYARVAIKTPTQRLIPSRFPPVSAFEDVASAEDLAAVMELEGWTNDRLVVERLARLPPSQWVFGRANASVIMAAFLHAAPMGQRFSGPELGAWYAAFTPCTAVAEAAHHVRREVRNPGLPRIIGEWPAYSARLDGAYLDLRGADRPDLYDADDYSAGQAFGEALRARGEAGIVYDSVRHAGGTNVVAYRPSAVLEVTQGAHLELTVPAAGRIIARRLS